MIIPTNHRDLLCPLYPLQLLSSEHTQYFLQGRTRIIFFSPREGEGEERESTREERRALSKAESDLEERRMKNR